MTQPKRALLSVTDKTGIFELASNLARLGFRIVSTGGTAAALREGGLCPTDVSEVTGFPEALDGRIKTLHPKIHGGLLADVRNPQHVQQLDLHKIEAFDLLVVNLYRFEDTVSKPHEFEQAIESIDIGGPAMIRAASKNWANVTVVVDPNDYDEVIASLSEGASDALRLRLAAKAFRHTAYYDSLISRYLTNAAGETPFTETLTLGWRRSIPFRYAENPHQAGALYRDPLGDAGIANGRKLWGLELGYNNWNDADGAWELVADLASPACVISKHGNPCGAAVADSFAEAFRWAKESDPISAFGGVVAINGLLEADAAQAMTEKGNKLDVIVAEGFSEEALSIFKNRSGWGQEVRLVAAPLPPAKKRLLVRSISGGMLAQDSDEDLSQGWTVSTRKKPTDDQLAALKFLWKIVPHVKSNAIVVGTSTRLLGVGAGQMNRVQSVRLALQQAQDGAKGAGMASDAFFPFPDSVEVAAEAGISTIVQPGGSKKDAEVVAKADELGVSMCMTGVRHFRH